MVHGQSLGHSVFFAAFFACLVLLLPANATEVDKVVMAKIAKNIFFILI
jgi:hypothetical protein